MNELEQLLNQRAEIDARIQAAQRAAREQAIAQVRELLTRHGLSMADITARPPRAATAIKTRSGGKVAAKYRDEAGNAWSGRGLKPKWLNAALANGAQLSDFAV
jgi:DNA-binding protein H-NS